MIDISTIREPQAMLRGSNAAGMRAYNERLVLSLLRRHGPMAKVELARMTALSAQTMSVIMRSLEEDGLLIRGEPVRGKVGQPSVPMRLAPDGALFYGLKVGRRSSDLVLIDFLGKVIGRERTTYAYPEPAATLDFATRAHGRLQGQLDDELRTRVAGMGIALPFHLWDWAGTLGVPETDMTAWQTRDLRAELEAALGLTILIENDASSACGAELVFGDGGLPPDFVYFYVGYFVGGGVVLGDRLFTGASGNAGALGSMPVPSGGRLQQLIDVASLRGLEAALSEEGVDTSLLWGEPEAWVGRGPALDRWIETAAEGLAFAIAATTSVIDVDTAVIDGWLPAEVRASLVGATSDALGRIDLAGVRHPKVMPGTVGPDARALGAASLPLSQRFLIDAVR